MKTCNLYKGFNIPAFLIPPAVPSLIAPEMKEK